jgi:RNA polymerase sigma-70 factor (ECF subfamily)
VNLPLAQKGAMAARSAGQLDDAEPKVEPAASPAPSADVAALTSLMAKGDESAYRRFFELYFNRLLRYLLVVSAGREDLAREALQLTFLRVARHVKRFDLEAVFWSWLTVLARSAVVDELRKSRRRQSLLERFFWRQPPPPPVPDREADPRLLSLLEQELQLLPDEERALLEEKYLQGQPVKSLAHQYQASEKAIDSRLVRIRKKLKAAILAELNHENTD